MSAISTNNFDKFVPILVHIAALSGGPPKKKDYGVVGAESDAVKKLEDLLNDLIT